MTTCPLPAQLALAAAQLRSGVPLIPDNRPDNVWGKLTLPKGDTATIYNKGSVVGCGFVVHRLGQPGREGGGPVRKHGISAMGSRIPIWLIMSPGISGKASRATISR